MREHLADIASLINRLEASKTSKYLFSALGTQTPESSLSGQSIGASEGSQTRAACRGSLALDRPP